MITKVQCSSTITNFRQKKSFESQTLCDLAYCKQTLKRPKNDKAVSTTNLNTYHYIEPPYTMSSCVLLGWK